jgi:hypothetical protein
MFKCYVLPMMPESENTFKKALLIFQKEIETRQKGYFTSL